eukprot:5140403-Prymnesium_polylepis.1
MDAALQQAEDAPPSQEEAPTEMPHGDGATARASSRRVRRATAPQARDNSNNWTTTHGHGHHGHGAARPLCAWRCRKCNTHCSCVRPCYAPAHLIGDADAATTIAAACAQDAWAPGRTVR